jgi:hypothetical protein
MPEFLLLSDIGRSISPFPHASTLAARTFNGQVDVGGVGSTRFGVSGDYRLHLVELVSSIYAESRWDGGSFRLAGYTKAGGFGVEIIICSCRILAGLDEGIALLGW